MGLVTRTVLLFVVILAAALGVSTYLNFNKFEKTLFGLAQSRYNFVLFDIKNAVEYNLSLGLPLNVVRQIQPALERETVRDDNILSIVIYDERGIALFSSERGGIGDKVPGDWQNRAHNPGDAAWLLSDAESFVIGVPLVNAFGQTVGGAALRYAKAGYTGQVTYMLLGLAKAAGIIFFLTMIVAAAVIVFLYRGMLRRLVAHDATLKDLAAVEEGDPSVDPAVGAYIRRARQTMTDIELAEREIEAIDQTA